MFNKKQEEVLLKTKLFGSYLVNIKRHMLTGHILDGMSEEIKICLAQQFISKAESLIWKRDGKHNCSVWDDTCLPILSKPCGVHQVPEVWTHPTKVCFESVVTAVILGMVKLCCVNYSAAHVPNDRNCPMHQDERPIRNLKSRKVFCFGHLEKVPQNQT
jgi:hypothetical protein